MCANAVPERQSYKIHVKVLIIKGCLYVAPSTHFIELRSVSLDWAAVYVTRPSGHKCNDKKPKYALKSWSERADSVKPTKSSGSSKLLVVFPL